MNRIIEVGAHIPSVIIRLFTLAGNKESYYPDSPHKAYLHKLFDLTKWFVKYHEVNKFYYLYGFDVASSHIDMDSYMDYRGFMSMRAKMNRNHSEYSQIVLLRDKYLFDRYMEINGFPVPKVFAVLHNGKLYDSQMNEIEPDSLRNRSNYFIKEINGECASFVKKINDYDALMSILPELKGSFIFQCSIEQNTTMNTLNNGAINTLRIVTVNNGKTIKPLTSLLRVGTSKTGNVDNWAAGGLAIGIDEDGSLKQYGYYKPIHGLKTRIHPDSGIEFLSFKVPFYKEALQLACRAHSFFYNIGSIGWDIAIGEDGPIFVEGNDNWEISLQQACDRPLRREWENLWKNN